MSGMTRTEIVNLALRHLGATRVEDWAETQPEAIVMRDVWDQGRRMTLGRHGWQFAMTGAELALSAFTPPTRYAYRYSLPVDFVRLDAVSDSDTMEPPLDMGQGFVMRNGYLDCSSTRVWIEYVYDAPIEGVWPPHFVSVMAVDLASMAAGSLKSTTEHERFEKLLAKALSEAISTDSAQQKVQFRRPGPWRMAARGAWRG